MKTKLYSQTARAGNGLMVLLLALLFSGMTYGQAPALTLLSPNGSETWLQGSTCTITWHHDGEPADLFLEYTEDGGNYWYYLDYVYAYDSVNSYTFQNYIYVTDQAKIRISYYNDPAVNDESDGFFTVTEPPVYFYSPYYGDFYYRTAPVLISWYSFTLETFTLDYSLDNGTTWNSITSNFTGFEYTWTSPDQLSDSAMIRVSDASDPSSYGLSPLFSIVEIPTLSLSAPNGGEVWTYGGTATVSWTGTNLPYYLYMDFSYDGGINWTNLGYGYSEATGGTAEVYVPYVATENALVRIYDPYYIEVMDESNASFTVVVPPVLVNQPYEGQQFYNKSTTYISWLAYEMDSLNIELSTDNGQTWEPVAEGLDANYGYYNWTIAAIPSESCILRLSDATDPARFGLSTVFTILEAPVVTLNSPLGGEIWNTSADYTISWTYDNPSAYYLYLEYSTDNGEIWNYIDYVNHENSEGSYTWTTPDVNSDQCLIRIRDYSLYFVSDTSDVFSILTFPETPICMVSVDSTTNHNIVVWEKPVSDLIDKFVVYKETDEANIYEPIGVVNYDETAVFADTNSNPNMKSYRYRLGFEDAEGHLFPAGNLHQTIHLTINQGVGNSWNLIWTSYTGFEVASYIIYRKAGSGNYEQIGTISSSFNSYTDLGAPAGDVYYVVEVINPNGCNPARSDGYSSSYSNIATNNVLGVNDLNTLRDITTFPNPANDRLNISAGESLKGKVSITINNLLGQTVYSEEIEDMHQYSTHMINTIQFTEGIYMLKVTSEKGSVTKKIVVKH